MIKNSFLSPPYWNPDAYGAGLDPILHATLAKSQAKQCQTGSSLRSCKLKWLSAVEIDIPLSQTGSLPSITEVLGRFLPL